MYGRLFIEDTEIDLSDDFSNQITYAVDDLRNFDSKSTAFTKTIILPGTTRNNQALGNIFEITTANYTTDVGKNVGYNFNASRSAKCRLEVNGMQIIKGSFRLLEIIKDNKFIEYEAQIVGELGGLISKLANKRLEDLDFSEYNQAYEVSNIIRSWQTQVVTAINTSTTFTAATKKIKINLKILSFLKDGDIITISDTVSNNGTYTIAQISFRYVFWDRYTEITTVQSLVDATDNNFNITYNRPYGTGLFYPTIDYGNVSTDKVNFQYTAFRPALFVREYIDKIMKAAGYTYESTFFDTPFFKRLIIPNNAKGIFKKSDTGYITANTTALQGTPYGNFVKLKFPTHTLTNFTIDANNEVFTYNNPNPATTKLRINIQGYYIKTLSADDVVVEIISGDGTLRHDFDVSQINFENFDLNFTLNSRFVNGSELYVHIKAGSVSAANPNSVWVTSCNFVLEKDPPGKVELPLGELIDINDTIPKGIFQKDFFASLLKMFNLIVSEDKFKSNHLVIEPYPDFYLTSGYIDWSSKIARDRPMRIKPMSELNARYYQLKYKQDNDFYNEAYRKKYNEGYGDRVYDTSYEFAKETDSLEVIFSASPLYGATGTDKVYPAIYKKSGNEGFEDTIEHNIRIMQAKRITDVNSWDILNGNTVVGTQTEYGYAGHLDDPDLPAADISFGVPKELYFGLASGDLTANLFNAYYSPYLAEITDKDSRLLTAEFRLTPQDIYDLNFRKLIYIDGALFRLSKVIDWNTNGDELTKVELLKVINLIY